MQPLVQLSAAEVVPGRPFAAAEHTLREQEVMRHMLGRVRGFAAAWPPGRRDFLLQAPDGEGLRHWLRVPDCAALLAAERLTVVGFFGQARADVDQAPIHDLEAGIVDTLETVAGVLVYYDLELAAGVYGNLILCAGPDAPGHVHGHALHRRAVELTPGHYHAVRLHSGGVDGPLRGGAELVLERTRYFDYDSEPPWLAVRTIGLPA